MGDHRPHRAVFGQVAGYGLGALGRDPVGVAGDASHGDLDAPFGDCGDGGRRVGPGRAGHYRAVQDVQPLVPEHLTVDIDYAGLGVTAHPCPAEAVHGHRLAE